ncbi:MAG: tRNA (N(6)-L-threonylcarbamoyladenosine(37)-C(2))-methylthiotransferase [Hadesarchaea archaeon]|nr:tRNA (N(6)-L-threonylcarbamoyladenosine(37)-C(2))-methylthiotransferase [Hadesarchaea archaeon]
MRVYCETYGCTMNKGDSELMLGHLVKAGHLIVESPDDADLIIVNTCAVKGPTLRRVLRRLEVLRQLDGKKLVVAGCLPLIDPKSLDLIGPIDGVVPCRSVGSISKVVDKIAEGGTNVCAIGETREKVCVPKLRSSRVSAIVPISEGCVSNCSYCAVKLARGRLRSFDKDKILTEIGEAVRSGRREILLTAQDTGAYGVERGESLPELLQEISEIDGKFKVRIGMMNPATAKPILRELIDAFESEKIYKFLHLPVQSGDDSVLRKMRRNYTVEEFLRIVKRFKDKFSNLYFATDVIVGFPGESEEAFQNTCKLIEKIRPDKVNVTRFSPMPGTEAAKMRPQIDGREKKRRSRLLSAMCKEIGRERNMPYVGRVEEGLVVEPGTKGGYIVRLSNYKPVIVREARMGDFVKVKITEARHTYLLGELEVDE